MAKRSASNWTDATFNSHIGCEPVSPGCKHCYAEVDYDTRRGFANWGQHGTRVMTSDANWRQLRRWDSVAAKGNCIACTERVPPCPSCNEAGTLSRLQTVFCCSLSDVFEEWSGPIYNRSRKLAPDSEPVWFQTPNDWRTVISESDARKHPGSRPVLMDDVRNRLFWEIDECPHLMFLILTKRPENILRLLPSRRPGAVRTSIHRANVMFGASAEDQPHFERRIGYLDSVRHLCAGVFLAAEPLIGPITLRGWPMPDWVIVCGETGAKGKPRPMAPNWARALRDECQQAAIPFHLKQMGGGPGRGGRVLDGQIHDQLPSILWEARRTSAE